MKHKNDLEGDPSFAKDEDWLELLPKLIQAIEFEEWHSVTFLAGQIKAIFDKNECVCAETGARNCPVHQ